MSPGTPNEPPAIIRPAQLVAIASDTNRTAFFQVRAVDDSGPFELRSQWELVSIPDGAAPQFDPSGLDSVQFDMLGDYTFRVAVTDAQGLSAVGYTTYTVSNLFQARGEGIAIPLGLVPWGPAPHEGVYWAMHKLKLGPTA